MKLRARVILLYLLITLLVLVLFGIVLPATLHQQNLDSISANTRSELRHIDFALTGFISEARYDVHELSLNDRVRTRDDAGFTSFLNASENTFRYTIGDREQQIITLLRDYQISHPYVSSVYMGRENGAFVRSYPRARPTPYDPRDRPWYILARDNPGMVSVTEPYRSVTTPDTNIGIVTPLFDENGTMIGVIGADITLVNLTRYIATARGVEGGEMILTDRQGTIIASRDESRLFGSIQSLIGNQTGTFLETDEGVLVLDGTYLIYVTSPELGWKICTFLPAATIDQRINASIVGILVILIFALLLLSLITLAALNYTVLHPIARLTEVSREIADSGDLGQAIPAEGAGEIGTLARSFKAMMDRIRFVNHKLALMTEVTYQDIQNKVTAARGMAELSRNETDAKARTALIEREMEILGMIHSLIQKTKDYQQMGVDKPRWILLERMIPLQFAHLSGKEAVELAVDLDGLEILADPLFDRVFHNLLHNSLRHGRTVTRIAFSWHDAPEGIVLLCEDNGIGIVPDQKERIFARIVGGAGKFGLFFVREFLSLSGMSIRETGEPGQGARFEITIPRGLYRFREP